MDRPETSSKVAIYKAKGKVIRRGESREMIDPAEPEMGLATRVHLAVEIVDEASKKTQVQTFSEWALFAALALAQEGDVVSYTYSTLSWGIQLKQFGIAFAEGNGCAGEKPGITYRKVGRVLRTACSEGPGKMGIGTARISLAVAAKTAETPEKDPHILYIQAQAAEFEDAPVAKAGDVVALIYQRDMAGHIHLEGFKIAWGVDAQLTGFGMPAAPPVNQPDSAGMDALIGLDHVKRDVIETAELGKKQMERRQAGLRCEPIARHMVFYGPSGTGKTSMARIVADEYFKRGLLSKGHVVEVDRSGLIAAYMGQTALKVQEVVASALGGVLFIDEAYALLTDDRDSYGIEAIATLLKLMEDHREDLVVILAGYTKPMKRFIESNSGLNNRFTKYFLFESYSPDELVKIYESFCAKQDYVLRPGALAAVRSRLTALWEKGHEREDFGNGRTARNLFEKTQMRQAWRLKDGEALDRKDLATITASDVPPLTDLRDIYSDTPKKRGIGFLAQL